jgi:hypothetical protein
MRLEPGTILWLEDAQWQQGFQIHKQLGSMQGSLYIGVSLNDMEKLLTVIVGAHPSQLEPCWEDMSTWYQVSFVCVSQVLTLVSRFFEQSFVKENLVQLRMLPSICD